MNTKFSITLLAVLIVLLVSLAITTSFSKAPASADLDWPPRPNLVPATGADDASDYHQRHSELSPANDLSDDYRRLSDLSSAEAVREALAARLWSREVSLSDNDAPDVNIYAEQDLQSACTSEDSRTRPHGRCVE